MRPGVTLLGRLPQMPYDNEIYLTFDTDWASDAVIGDTVELLDSHGVAATMFATNASPVLAALAGHPRIELGIHPNFNPLLQPSAGPGAASILAALHDLYPGAVSVRSHSLFQSSGLQGLFCSRRLKFDLNMFIPSWSGIECKPYREVNDIARLPYFWEDDVYVEALSKGIVAGWNVDGLLSTRGLKVFDFHPIHVFLNTENMDRYRASQADAADEARLRSHRGESYGTRNFLIDLIARGVERGFTFRAISDIKV